MHSAKATTENNLSIMTPLDDKDGKDAQQQSSEKGPEDAAAMTKEGTITKEDEAAIDLLPPDLKEAKNSPSRGNPQEVADLLFSASPPSNNKVERNKAPENAEESAESKKEVQSTPNTPLRGGTSSSKEFTPKKKKMRSWLSLSPSRRKMKDQTTTSEGAESTAADNERTVATDKAEAEKEKPEEEIQEKEATTATAAAGHEIIDTPDQVEQLPEMEGKGNKESATKTKSKQGDYDLVTVGEGVDGVREAERRNYARATSTDDLSVEVDVPKAQDQPAENETQKEEMNSLADSPEFKAENDKEKVEADEGKQGNLSEDEGQEKAPTTSKSKKKKKWFKPPKINLSFNKKRAKKKMESEEPLPVEPEEKKEEKKNEPEVEVEVEELEDALEEVAAAGMGVGSTGEISHKDKTGAEPRADEVLEINNFLRLVVMFISLGFLAASIVDPGFACTPTPHGIVLDKITLKQYASEAPWWAPASLKSKGLFQLVCGDRPRTKLEWTFQKQSRDSKLHQLVISDQDSSDPKKKTLLKQKNLVSATIGLSEIYTVNKKGKEEVLSAPWSKRES